MPCRNVWNQGELDYLSIHTSFKRGRWDTTLFFGFAGDEIADEIELGIYGDSATEALGKAVLHIELMISEMREK